MVNKAKARKAQARQGGSIASPVDLLDTSVAVTAPMRASQVEVKVYRLSTAQRVLGLSKASIYRRIKDGTLVKVQLGPRATGITADSINALLTTIPATTQ